MKILNTTLIALAVLTTSAAGAYARDGVANSMSSQTAVDAYASNEAIFSSPANSLNSADREIIHHNDLGQR